MRTVFLAGLTLAAFAAPASAETRNINGFDNVSAAGNFRVEVAVGPSYSVSVTGSDAQRIRTRLENGDTLKIEPVRRQWFGNPHYDAVVRVTLPRLEGVSAARGSNFSATGGGACGDFSASAAMGADLNVRAIECDRVDASAAMGAQLTIAGTCGDLDVSASMGADVDADALRCRTVDASAAMGANVDAYASASYDASASMGGDIEVSGDGRGGDTSAAMGGSITGH